MPRRQSERFRDEVPLPEGWDVEKDVDGKPFFIDHNTQQTTWVDPRDRYVTPFYSCQTVISREFDWKPLSLWKETDHKFWVNLCSVQIR